MFDVERAAGGIIPKVIQAGQNERERRRKTKTGASLEEVDDGLEEESQCSQHTHGHKDPQEDPVDDHGHVLPVVLHLTRGGNAKFIHRISHSLCSVSLFPH